MAIPAQGATLIERFAQRPGMDTSRQSKHVPQHSLLFVWPLGCNACTLGSWSGTIIHGS